MLRLARNDTGANRKTLESRQIANADYVKRRREVSSFNAESEWRFAVPTSVMYDSSKGRLMVVDNQRSRLQIYKKLKNYMVPQMNL